MNHSQSIPFTGYLRRFVLYHALKNDTFEILIESAHKLRSLKPAGRTEYTCVCPWCRAREGFRLNKKTGGCLCSSCGKKGDLVDLIQLSQGVSIDLALAGLTAFLKKGGEI